MKYYKVLNVDGTPCHGGDGTWHLPHGNRPGEWMPRIENPEACVRGYHGCRRRDLLAWLGPSIYEMEYKEPPMPRDNKVVGCQARLLRKLSWNSRIARLFTADCAEHVLHIFEATFPGDERPRKAIQAARDYTRGIIDTAAWAAAWDAASDAARAAVWAAASAATRGAAWDAASDAARAAVWAASAATRGATWTAVSDAAKAATPAAASDAEKQWQTRRLFEYLYGKRSTSRV